MAEYTPGPWITQEVEDGHDIWLSPVSSHYRPEEKVEYHHGLFREYEDGESVEGPALEQFLIAEANARLIAAAPDLLVAAKFALATAEQWIEDQLSGTSLLEAEMAKLKPVRNAIAKAEGKENAEQRN